MKKIFTFLTILVAFSSFAQVPQGISYQAIALNGSGSPVVSSNIGVRLSVLDNTATGTVLYTETHIKTTNPQGLFNLVIGQGTVVTGTFSTINWGTNSKFLKVELDATGGTSYIVIGTTQLLSVPYALAAKKLITSAGDGITLVSPNGTPYNLSVNDNGQLSLPTSGSTSTLPASIYMYGSFNSWNAATSLLMGNFGTYSMGGTTTFLEGFKYLTAGTELKFLSQNNSSSPIYGINATNFLVQNGISHTVSSNGFYNIAVHLYSPNNLMELITTSIAPTLVRFNTATSNSTVHNATYNSATNTFTFNLTGIINTDNFKFNISNTATQSCSGNYFGDNLADNSIEICGMPISFPTATSTPKNYRVDLILNFNGSGSYTITQI